MDHEDVLRKRREKKLREFLLHQQRLAQEVATPESKRAELCKEYALEKAYGIKRKHGYFV